MPTGYSFPGRFIGGASCTAEKTRVGAWQWIGSTMLNMRRVSSLWTRGGSCLLPSPLYTLPTPKRIPEPYQANLQSTKEGLASRSKSKQPRMQGGRSVTQTERIGSQPVIEQSRGRGKWEGGGGVDIYARQRPRSEKLMSSVV